MSLFKRKNHVHMTWDRKPGFYPGKVKQHVTVQIESVKKGKGKKPDEVILRLTEYKVDAKHSLMDECTAGPFSDVPFHLVTGDSVRLEFDLDIPVTLR